MHEQSLMNGLMKKIEQVAVDEKAKRVSGIRVWLGAFSHMSEEHFMEHYRISAAGSIAEKAQVEIELSEDQQHPQAHEVILRDVQVELDE